MRIIFAVFFMALAFYGCKQEPSFDSPADEHIKEYMKQKNECDSIDGSKTNNLLENNNVQDPQVNSLKDDGVEEISENEDHGNTSKELQEGDSPQESEERSKELPLEKEHELVPNPSTTEQNLIIRKSMFDYSQYDIILGDPNSKVRVIAYTSPTCGACAYYNANIFNHIREKYINTNKISYVIREFIANRQDKDAAILAYCAGKDRFVQFMNILYSTQSSWAYSSNYLENLINIGKIGGVSEDAYNKCLNDTQLLNGIVGLTMEAAKSPKFVGTPVFFINGQMHQKAYSEKELSKAIDIELQKSQNEKK